MYPGVTLVHGVQVEQYCISTQILAMRELHHRCVPFTGTALVETIRPAVSDQIDTYVYVLSFLMPHSKVLASQSFLSF